MGLTIAITNDHGGVSLKKFLMEQDFPIAVTWLNIGTDTNQSVDYPDYGYTLSQTLKNKDADFGIAICGTGIGISMACNRHKNSRAAVCTTSEMARLTRIDNDANILCLGARIIDNDLAKNIVETFLTTDFESGGRHERRVNKLTKGEN